MIFKLTDGWKEIDDKFSLKNDQEMSFLCNYKAPCGEIVTLFKINEKVETGAIMFDKMISDYKDITPNLYLQLKSKIKIKEKIVNIYVIKERISNKSMVQMIFNYENTLYALIFNLGKYYPSTKECIDNNKIMSEVISLLEGQVWKEFYYIPVVRHVQHK